MTCTSARLTRVGGFTRFARHSQDAARRPVEQRHAVEEPGIAPMGVGGPELERQRARRDRRAPGRTCTAGRISGWNGDRKRSASEGRPLFRRSSVTSFPERSALTMVAFCVLGATPAYGGPRAAPAPASPPRSGRAPRRAGSGPRSCSVRWPAPGPSPPGRTRWWSPAQRRAPRPVSAAPATDIGAASHEPQRQARPLTRIVRCSAAPLLGSAAVRSPDAPLPTDQGPPGLEHRLRIRALRMSWIKDLVQAVAFTAAGIWAIYNFWYRERYLPRTIDANVVVKTTLEKLGEKDGDRRRPAGDGGREPRCGTGTDPGDQPLRLRAAGACQRPPSDVGPAGAGRRAEAWGTTSSWTRRCRRRASSSTTPSRSTSRSTGSRT